MESAIFFLSFDEPNAEENWLRLQRKVTRARRMHGVEGILTAHRHCAEHSPGPLFFIVDGDNEVLDSFDFSFCPSAEDFDAIHVWRCKNPVNDLVYGYGAIKLFPKALFREAQLQVDLSTSLARKYKIQPEIASITHFNADPLHTWRSAFRECVKLASGVIANHKEKETLARLEAWCNVGGDKKNGEWCIAGARAGREYGLRYQGDASALGKINDFSWLKKQFEAQTNG